jgi:hypothetical protein
VGFQALNANTTGANNIAVGKDSLDSNTTGSNNVAIGMDALQANTTSANNVAVGTQALINNTAANNTAVGNDALATNTSGTQNVAVGGAAGDAITTGGYNTFVGYNAAGAATTGTYNAFLGRSSGSAVTTGGKNTIIGSYNGNQNDLDIRTASNNIVLSDGDGVPLYWGRSSGTHVHSTVTAAATAFAVGINSTNASSQIIRAANACSNMNDFGATQFVVFGTGNVQNINNSYAAISDLKLKENIADAASQWDDIKAITVRKYSLKTENSDSPTQIGVIAQELEASGMSGLVDEHADLGADDVDLGTTTKAVKYSILYMKAIKALQEAMDRIETLEATVTTLTARLETLEG